MEKSIIFCPSNCSCKIQMLIKPNDAHEIYEVIYEVILPQLKNFIHKYGGYMKVKVGGEEDKRKVYSIKN